MPGRCADEVAPTHAVLRNREHHFVLPVPTQNMRRSSRSTPEKTLSPAGAAQTRRKEPIDEGEESLDAHVLEPTPDYAGETVPCLCFAMVAFRSPAIGLVKPPVLVRQPLAPPPSAQERGIVVANDNGLRVCPDSYSI